MHNLLMDWIFN